MSDERLILETIARCVAIMVNYHNTGPKDPATREMVAEIRAVAEEVEKFSLGIHDVVERLFRPVESELLVRYGHELGTRMNSHFLSAFERPGTPRRITPGASIMALASRPVHS